MSEQAQKNPAEMNGWLSSLPDREAITLETKKFDFLFKHPAVLNLFL